MLNNRRSMVEDIIINKTIIEYATDYIVGKKYMINTYRAINKVRRYKGLLLPFKLFRENR